MLAWAVRAVVASMGLGLMTLPLQAMAACTPATSPITCAPDDYSSGIDYQNDPPGGPTDLPGLQLTLLDNVVVSTTAGADGVAVEQSGNIGLTTGQNVAITIGDTGMNDRDGIRLDSNNGSVTIDSNADIVTGNTEGDGIVARSNLVDNEDPAWNDTTRGHGAGNVTVESRGKIAVGGDRSVGISAMSSGAQVSLTVTGDVSTAGATESSALLVQNHRSPDREGVASANITDVELSTVGSRSAAVAVSAERGTALVNIIGGSIATQGEKSLGIGVATGTTDIYRVDRSIFSTVHRGMGATINNGTAGAAANDGATVSTRGDWASGLGVISRGGPVNVLNRGNISTAGDVATGIAVLQSYIPGQMAPVLGGALNIDNRATIVTGDAALDPAATGDSAAGILALAFVADITITSSGAITTYGDTISVPEYASYYGFAARAAGIQAAIQGTTIDGIGDVRVTTSNTGTILTHGSGSDGINVHSVLDSSVINAGGAIATLGEAADGIDASSDFGSVDVTAAAISTRGAGAYGVRAETLYHGSVGIDTLGGAVATFGDDAYGIFGRSPDEALSIVAGSVATSGLRSHGIRAEELSTLAVGSIAVDATAGTISTLGQEAYGLSAVSQAGAIQMSSAGISTAGAGATGLSARSSTGAITIDAAGGAITTRGSGAVGIDALTDGAVNIDAGPVTTTGQAAAGMLAISRASTTAVGARGAVLASGEFSPGIVALSRTSTADVAVAGGADVKGGWAAAPGAIGANGFAAAGVVLGGAAGVRDRAALLDNSGRIGAASDMAIASADLFAGLAPAMGGGILVENRGTITGYVKFGAGANVFNNYSPDSFDIRHFADTNGDGVQDSEKTAVSDFGGPGALFHNTTTGVVRLLTVSGAATADSTDAYIPAGRNPSFHEMSAAGIEQGHLVNLATFRNVGTITLQDMETGGTSAVAGDVLVITGSAVAGTSGGGVFVSEGGQLRLDAVLNEGGANSRSDMLVVDGTQLGVGGATRVFVANSGGLGAWTIGDGIKLVDVLNAVASAADAFVLGDRVAAGAYEYLLFRGGNAEGGDPQDGDWYLRNIRPTDPPGEPGTPGAPNYRVEVPLYTALSTLGQQFGFAMLGTAQQRRGDNFGSAYAGAPAASAFQQADTTSAAVAVADRASSIVSAPGRTSWVRSFAESGDHAPDAKLLQPSINPGDEALRQPHYDYDLWGFQLGADLYRREHAQGQDYVGVYVGAGHVKGKVDGLYGGSAGSVSMDGKSVGAYWSHFGQSGWYTDLVAQGTRYGKIQARSVGGQQLRTEGSGWTVSLEGGYPFALRAGWVLEPQIQFVRQSVSLDDGQDAFGLIDFARSADWLGRIGARLVNTFELRHAREPRRANVWGHANFWRAFDDGAKTIFSTSTAASPVGFDSALGDTAQIGLGASLELSRKAMFYGAAHYSVAVGAGEGHALGGMLGIRSVW